MTSIGHWILWHLRKQHQDFMRLKREASTLAATAIPPMSFMENSFSEMNSKRKLNPRAWALSSMPALRAMSPVLMGALEQPLPKVPQLKLCKHTGFAQ